MRKVLALLALLFASPALAQSIQVPAGGVIGNSTAAQRQGRAETLTAIIDRAMGSTRGSILERGASGWAIVAPGTAGLSWVSAGAGADPLYGIVGLNGGGCNAALTASLGGILYSTATACAVLPGTATARQMLQSGASAAPAWSTTTWPATTTINRILWSSAANVISDLATANSSILVTDGGGIPSLSTTLPAFTLGGTVSGGGNQINNVIIGTTTPLAGSFTSLAYSTTLTGTSTNANCGAIGRQGATNPVLQVDCSTATVATGLKVKGAAAAGGLAMSVITSGTNENLTIDAAGSGTITLGATSTGSIVLSRALTYGGVTLTNAVTGTGSMVLSSAPTLAGLTLSGTLSGGGNQINNVIIGTSTPLAGTFTTLSTTGSLTVGTTNGTLTIKDTGGATANDWALSATGNANFNFANITDGVNWFQIAKVTGAMAINSTVAATSATTGSIKVSGGAGIAGAIWAGTYVASTPTTVGTSGTSCSIKGARWFVTDNNTAAAFGAVITSGGALQTPIYCDGTVWRQG